MTNHSYGRMPLNQLSRDHQFPILQVKVAFRDEAKLPKCAEEDTVVAGASCDISKQSISSSSLLRVSLPRVEELGVGV